MAECEAATVLAIRKLAAVQTSIRLGRFESRKTGTAVRRNPAEYPKRNPPVKIRECSRIGTELEKIQNPLPISADTHPRKKNNRRGKFLFIILLDRQRVASNKSSYNKKVVFQKRESREFPKERSHLHIGRAGKRPKLLRWQRD